MSQPTAVATYRPATSSALSVVEVREQVNRIQEVMRNVMKPEVHYGKVPGTDKPTLFKPGAEVLGVTFKIATRFEIDDLSTPDVVRYRIRAIGTHQTSGIVLGEGMGECSSSEEKYKWRRSFIEEEFLATPESHRRIKYAQDRQSRKVYKNQQIRTEPADVANTILKMACKRAQVAMTLNVLAASDIFAQDIEDLPEGIAHDEGGHDDGPRVPPPQSTRPKPNGPPPAAEEGADNTPANENVIAALKRRLEGATLTVAELHKKFPDIPESLEGVTITQVNKAIAWTRDPQQ